MPPLKNTFSFIFPQKWHLCARSNPSTPGAQLQQGSTARSALRGFTLLEMMIVVVIITILATMAIPSALRQMQTRRADEAATAIGGIYRGANMQAKGRGGAILVRYNAGVITTFEAIRGLGTGAPVGCEILPEASCITAPDRWGTARSQQLTNSNFVASGTYTVVANTTVGVTPTPTTTLDICYSPSGRTYSRTNVAAPLTPMVSPVTIDLVRADGVGLTRRAIITSAGNSRNVSF